MNGSFATVVAQKKNPPQLDASTAASGPHDFAVRFTHARLRALCVHRISPHVRDDRERPSMGETSGVMRLIWVRTKAEYFSIPGLTQFLKIRSDLPVAPVDRTPLPPHRHCERSEAIHSAACGDVDCFVASLLAMTGENFPHHASIHGRFLVVRASGFGTERRPDMIH